jgi:hypothetical protein
VDALFAWFAYFAVENPGLSFCHSRNLLRKLSALDDCGPFRPAEGEMAAAISTVSKKLLIRHPVFGGRGISLMPSETFSCWGFLPSLRPLARHGKARFPNSSLRPTKESLLTANHAKYAKRENDLTLISLMFLNSRPPLQSGGGACPP